MKRHAPALLSLILAMAIFGTIGLLKRHIPLGSGTVALFRAAIGSLFLLLGLLVKRRDVPWRGLLHRLPLLALSGACIGINWILLFEAYRYTTVAVATVSYYMAPVLMIVAATLLFRERLSPVRALCLVGAVAGMLLVSGLLEPNGSGGDGRGVLLGLGAALLYAAVILQNRYLSDVPAYERTLCQMLAATLVLLPYVLIAEDITAVATIGTPALLLLLTAGILHTGVAYVLYFFSVGRLGTATVALFSYLDPVIAVFLSALVLGEGMTPLGIVGTVAVLLSAALGELLPLLGHREHKNK